MNEPQPHNRRFPLSGAASPSEKWILGTRRLGREAWVHEELASTNTTAAEMILSHEADGLVVIARHQTAGRGQYGRVWHSRPGDSLLMSAIVLPSDESRRAAILTGFTAVAMADAVYRLTGLQCRIKWPNDLLLQGKKVCGILIEQHGPAAIIGIGLNLNQEAADFEAANLPDATSLRAATGQSYDLRSVVECVIQRIDEEYERLLSGGRTAVEADWKWRLGMLGRMASIELMDGMAVAGRLKDMSFEKLELEMGDGAVRAIVPESVRHIAELR